MKVAWQAKSRSQASNAVPPVVVRPVIPGAVVTPAEQTLDASGPAREAVFYVTPLALGKIPDARVAVIPSQGSRQEIPLPMKSLRQRLTLWLLLLTFLVPAFLFYTCKYEKLEDLIPEKVPRSQARQPPPRGNQAAPRMQTRMVWGQPGQVLEFWINEKLGLPKIPYVTENVASGLGQAYQFLCIYSDSEPLAFQVGLAFLVLTGISWIAHMRSRARRRSKPMHLSPPEEAQPIFVSPEDQAVRPAEIVEVTKEEPAERVRTRPTSESS
jgi:hypothetical protein